MIIKKGTIHRSNPNGISKRVTNVKDGVVTYAFQTPTGTLYNTQEVYEFVRDNPFVEAQ